jgi:hypothetical protein
MDFAVPGNAPFSNRLLEKPTASWLGPLDNKRGKLLTWARFSLLIPLSQATDPISVKVIVEDENGF